ncbi:hypothetical protein AMECASPLE_033714 [Ameca splendens]|uniref:Uncharacterized protein n=1 Tax=Ameca splendens TaxID=208324 RepID=A0ABV0Y7G7_9TELE
MLTGRGLPHPPIPWAKRKRFYQSFRRLNVSSRVQMNVEIRASKNLCRKSPFCLPPGPRSLEITFYQASENPPPAGPPSYRSSFSPWCPLNGVKHKVRRTRKYFSPLLHPLVDLNHRGKDLFLPDLAKGLFA